MPSLAKIVCIDPFRVSEVFPHAQRFIHSAMLRGGGDFETVRSDVLSGPSLLWVAWDGAEIIGAAVTSLANINNKKICTIVACGADDFRRVSHMIDDLENFAIGEGCNAVRICGREGWGRVLKEYDVRSVVLEKEL